MKLLLHILTLTLTFSAFSQSFITRKIFAFETLERNSKTIQISKQTQDEGFKYFIIAENEASKDYVSCKWKTEISISGLALFTKMLKELSIGDSYESNLFDLDCNKNKVKVKFKKTKCISDHKTFYFQESCNRSLNFVIYKKQIEEIVKELDPIFIIDPIAVK